MKHVFSFSYLTCQSCTARIHCDQCSVELQQRLTGKSGISNAQVDIPNKYLSIDAVMDEDDLLDLLEDMSIFAD